MGRMDDGPFDKLLSHLQHLDRYQLEGFKLGLRSPRLLPKGSPQVPWASLKAAGPAELLWLLRAHFPGPQVWDVALRVSEDLRLAELCGDLRAQVDEMAQGPQGPGKEEEPEPESEPEPEEVPTELSVHRGRYRVRLKAQLLAMWDATPWPEDHIYLRNFREQEHRALRRLLQPGAPGALPRTVVLHGPAGVGKTTLAMQVALHWAEGLLFQRSFEFAFYISGHRARDPGPTTLLDLLSRDWPEARVPIEHALDRPERLLLVIDGLEEVALPPAAARRPPCTDRDRRLPAAAILLHLLRKELLPAAVLLVTTRDWHLEDLRGLCPHPRCLPVPGFTEEDRSEYFFRFFKNQREATKVLQWVGKSEALSLACRAPLVCWTVCSCLQHQLARRPSFWLDAQTPTGLYACLFAGVVEAAEVSWSQQRWAEQWQALCSLAARGLWSCSFTFAKEEVASRLRASLVRGLLRRGILREVADCGDCLAFAHPSFQAFLAALFYVLRGKAGAVGGLPKPQELRTVLAGALVDVNPYWLQTALFAFGFLNRDLAGQVEGALRCPLAPRAADELAQWAEELSVAAAEGGAPYSFQLLPWFQCLHETREESLARKLLGHLLEADLAVGDLQLPATAFCLKLCPRLSRLRLSVSCLGLQTELAGREDWAGTRLAGSKKRQWQDVCSVFHSGHVSELDLSDSMLSAAAMRRLCYELRNPRCKLQKLTCRSITPVQVLKELVLLLHGNNRLTHLNLSSNTLGFALSTLIFRTLRHSACKLKYLWLESCGLTPVACCSLFLELSKNASLRFLSLGDNDLSGLEVQSFRGSFNPAKCALKELSLEQCGLSGVRAEEVASVLSSSQRTARLCLAFNQLQDEGLRWLCASLCQPGCALRRLVLCSCELGAPSGQRLADTLLQNPGLTHLNLRRNQLGDEGVRALSEALGHTECSLQSLDLSECAFGEEGCWVLAEALGRNACLKVLDVGGNRIRDAGGKRLFATLRRPGCILNTLGLESCGLTSACCKDLALALGVRRSLVNLNLLGNDLGPEGVGTLWTSLQKPSCKLEKLGLEKDLYHLVEGKLQALQEKGNFLRILCKWDFNEPEDKWWW